MSCLKTKVNMGRKKDDDVWNHFKKEKGGVDCNFCKQHYKSENVTKMRKHLISCFHCPENIKLRLKQMPSLDENLAEKVSDSLDLAGVTTESASTTPQSSRASTPHSSRASTPISSRPTTPNVQRFFDRMTEKENVSYRYFAQK